MPRRIEIELTSARDDGTFTWRAAGAKQPKGVVVAELLYPGAKAGDVIRADAEQGLDGIDIVGVVPPAGARVEKERVEIVGSGRNDHEGVVTNLAPKGRGRDGDRPRGPRDRDDRGPRGPRDGGPRGERGPRTGGDRPERVPRDNDRRGPRPARDGQRPEGGRPGRPAGRAPAVKVQAGSAHRDAAVEALEGGDQAIAIEWLKGGIQAVRKAATEQNEANKAEGKPEVKPELLVSRAEHLIPALREAKWWDEAEATAKVVDEVALRDLRALVTAADGAVRSDDTRALATDLRAALERRVGALRDAWTTELTTALEEGRVVRALNLSARAPDAATKLSADLAKQLADAASAAMNPDAKPGTWSQLLTAVLDSPVRRSVQPVGLPAEPGPALLSEAKQAAGRVPALGKMLGVAIPPPPGARPKPADEAAPAAEAPAEAPAAEAPAAAPAAEVAEPEVTAAAAEPVAEAVTEAPATEAEPAEATEAPSEATD